MEKPKQQDRSMRDARYQKRARKPNMAAAPMAYHRRRAPKIEAARNRNVPRHCSVAVQTSLPRLRVTTLRDAQWKPQLWPVVCLASMVVVLMGLPKPRDRIIRDVQELRSQRKKNPQKKLRKLRWKLDAQLRLMDVALIMLLKQRDRTKRDVLHVSKSRLDVARMVKRQLTVGAGRDAVWRRLMVAAQIISTQLAVQVWKAADASIRHMDAVQIIRRLLEATTTWVAAVSMLNSGVVQIRKLRPRDLTSPDVHAMRSNLDAVQMESLPPRDHTIMDATARTASSSVARTDKQLRRDQTLKDAHVLPASTVVVRMVSTKPKETNLKVANWYPSPRRRLASSRRTWEPVITTQSSTSSMWNTVAVEDSGMVDAMETRTDSTQLKTVRMFAKCPMERTDVSSRRLPDRALDTTRCGTTIRIGTRALSSRTVDAWVMPIGSKRLKNARAPAWLTMRCHLAINQWKLDHAMEHLHVGTTKRRVMLANHSFTAAARATRTTIQRRVPATTIARNLEFTSRAAQCQWRLAVVMASWPVGTLPGTIINACPSTTPVVVAIITSLSRWTSAKSSVHRRSRRTSASCLRKLENVRTILPTGTLIRKNLAADSSTTVGAAETETTLSMNRLVSTVASRVKKRHQNLPSLSNPLKEKNLTVGIASLTWTPVTEAVSNTNAGTIMTAVRESAWTLRTPVVVEIRTTLNDTTNAKVLAEVLRMLVHCDHSTDGVKKMRHDGTTISAANGVTHSRSVDAKAMQTTSTRNRTANDNVGQHRLLRQNRNENKSQNAQHSRLKMFAMNRTNTAPETIRISYTCSTRNARCANRIIIAEKVAMETVLDRKSSVNGNAENIEESMFVRMPRMPDHAKKPFRDSTTIREREHVIHSTTAAAKAMETDLLPRKSANRLAWISMSQTKSILARATTRSAGRSIVPTVLPDRTIQTTIVNDALAKSLVLPCDVRLELNAPWICRATTEMEPRLSLFVDLPAKKANVLDWLTQRFVRMLAERMPTVAVITSAAKLDVLRFVFHL